jgi:hypothetical protein
MARHELAQIGATNLALTACCERFAHPQDFGFA